MQSHRSSITDFQMYIQHFRLLRAQIASAARVPQSVVWRVEHGQAVRAESAAKIRDALLTLTTVPYTGSIVLFEEITTRIHPVPLHSSAGAQV